MSFTSFFVSSRAASRRRPLSGHAWLAGLAAGFLSVASVRTVVAEGSLNFNLKCLVDTVTYQPRTFYIFDAGKRHLMFSAPEGWEVRGDAATLAFDAKLPAGTATARFRVATAGELLLLTAGHEAQREPVLRKNLPPGCTEIQAVGELDPNPLPVYDFAGVEATYQYNFFGQTLKTAVMICKLENGVGFVLVASAPAEKFEDFIGTLRGTLGSLQPIATVPADAK